MVMSIGPRGREIRPVRGRRRPSWEFEGKQEAAATLVTTAPGPGSEGSCPRQLSAATLGPQPSHGGAACAYTYRGRSCEPSRRNPTSLVGILATVRFGTRRNSSSVGRRGIIRGRPPVAQWIRATDFGSVGRGFESLRAGHTRIGATHAVTPASTASRRDCETAPCRRHRGRRPAGGPPSHPR